MDTWRPIDPRTRFIGKIELISIIEYPVRPDSERWFQHLAKLANVPEEIICIEVATPEGNCWMPKAEMNTNPPRGAYIIRESRKRSI